MLVTLEPRARIVQPVYSPPLPFSLKSLLGNFEAITAIHVWSCPLFPASPHTNMKCEFKQQTKKGSIIMVHDIMNKPFFVFVCHWVYLRAFHKAGYVHKGCPSSLCEPREPKRARKVMGQYHLQKGTRMMFDSWSMISIELDRYRSELYLLLRCNWLLHLLVITCMCVCVCACLHQLYENAAEYVQTCLHIWLQHI